MFLTLGDCWCGCPTNLMMIDTGWRRACSITAILVRSLGAIAASERDNAATDRISLRCSQNAGRNFRVQWTRARSALWEVVLQRSAELSDIKVLLVEDEPLVAMERRRSVERRRRYRRGALCDSRAGD